MENDKQGKASSMIWAAQLILLSVSIPVPQDLQEASRIFISNSWIQNDVGTTPLLNPKQGSSHSTDTWERCSGVGAAHSCKDTAPEPWHQSGECPVPRHSHLLPFSLQIIPPFTNTPFSLPWQMPFTSTTPPILLNFLLPPWRGSKAEQHLPQEMRIQVGSLQALTPWLWQRETPTGLEFKATDWWIALGLNKVALP